MPHAEPKFPFFIATELRSLSAEEYALVAKIAANEAPEYQKELADLKVVGRCGCGACPTVFFQPHQTGEREQEIASYAGKDSWGGVVGILLWAKGGHLSQLEFYSVDGHDPWSIPAESTIERF